MKLLPRIAIPLSLLLLASCSVFKSTPAAPPDAQSQAQEINRNMVGTLTQFDKVTVNERGSPMDAKDEIQKQADARQAKYYQIIYISEAITPGVWRGEALLYK